MKLTTKILLIAIGVLILLVGYFSINMNHYKNESLRQSNNTRYYQSKYIDYITKSGLNVHSVPELFMSIDELKNSNDSLDKVLLTKVSELKIKENKIQSLQHYISTTISTLTGWFEDTTYINTTDTVLFEKDTLKVANLTSKWVDNYVVYNPKKNEVSVKTTSRDELVIIAHVVRETVAPRKKFFLWRWFQKKQNIFYFDVVNSNPNCKIKYSKIINTQKYDSK